MSGRGIKMSREITVRSVVRFAGWAAIIATILLILMKTVLDFEVSAFQIFSGFSSGLFAIYLGYFHEGLGE